MAKTRPTPENNSYEWYDWLINHISESMKGLKAIPSKKLSQFSNQK